MKTIFPLASLLLAFLTSNIYCQTQTQTVWTLQQCIDYAQKNNNTIKQQNLQQQSAQVSLYGAKMSYLPTVNGYASQDENNSIVNEYGITQPYKKTYATQEAGLQFQMNVWNGFKTLYSVQKSDFLVKASEQDVMAAKQDLAMQATSLFLDILYNSEDVFIKEKQIEVTKEQINRTTVLVDAGSLSKIELSRLQMQQAQENADLITATYKIRQATLNLSLLLNLQGDSAKNFTVEKVSLPDIGTVRIDAIDSIFQNAIKTYPAIHAKELYVKGAESGISIAKTSGLPSVYFKGQLYTNYNGTQTEWPTYTQKMSYGNQFADNNVVGQLSLGVSIPIFNQFTTRTAVNQAKISVISAQLSLDIEKTALLKQVQTSWFDAMSSKEQYAAREEALRLARETFAMTTEQYNAGAINGFNYLIEKNNLTKAESELLLAKYQLLFRVELINLIQGKSIVL